MVSLLKKINNRQKAGNVLIGMVVVAAIRLGPGLSRGYNLL